MASRTSTREAFPEPSGTIKRGDKATTNGVQQAFIAAPSDVLPESWDDFDIAFADAGILEIPTDWRLVEKEQLIGVPFKIWSWQFNESGIGVNREFVSVHIMTEDGRRLVFNDGSTGVYAQLRDITDSQHRMGGMVCANGLRVSRYDHPEFGSSETFYLT